MTDRSVVTRFRERLRYGLLTQEALDRLARAGLIYCPYNLVVERAETEPRHEAGLGSLAVRKLEPEHAAIVSALPCRPLGEDKILARMRTLTGYGVFFREELAGYTWVNLRAVQAPLTLVPLFDLGERGAYLFDMYIARVHRGKRLAPWLRYRVYRELMALGRDDIYSITLANNESSRRFKARLGAVEIERRLAFGVKSVIVHDRRLAAQTKEPLPSVAAFTHRGKLPTG